MPKHIILAFINLIIGFVGLLVYFFPTSALKNEVDLNGILSTWGLIFLFVSVSFFKKRLLFLLLAPILGLLASFLLFWSIRPLFLFIYIYVFSTSGVIFIGRELADILLLILFFIPILLLVVDFILARRYFRHTG